MCSCTQKHHGKARVKINEGFNCESYFCKVVLQLKNVLSPVIRIIARWYFMKTSNSAMKGRKKCSSSNMLQTELWISLKNPTNTRSPILWENVNTGIPVSREEQLHFWAKQPSQITFEDYTNWIVIHLDTYFWSQFEQPWLFFYKWIRVYQSKNWSEKENFRKLIYIFSMLQTENKGRIKGNV